MNRAILDRQMFAGGGAAFPDLSGDGKVTQKDILMGRGVVSMAGGGNVQYYEEGGQTSFRPTAEGIAKQIALAFKMGGPQAGAQMRDRAIEMGADPSIANEIFDSMMLSTSGALSNMEAATPTVDPNSMMTPDQLDSANAAMAARIQAEQAAMYDENAASNPNRQMDDRMKPTMRPEMGMAYGGMVDPRMRQPVGMAEGGMMVDEGIGALPMGQGMDGPEVAMEQTLGAAAEGIGALDASQDYEEAINSVRGDQLPMEARYEELASFVGPNDAAQTPESVLALVQPVMQMAEVDQGIGSIAPDAMGGEAPMTPEMAGGIMSNVPEAPPMDAGPPQPFNQGGAARDINNPVQYYADGGAVQYFAPDNKDRVVKTKADAELSAELDKRLGLFQELGLGSDEDRAKSLENQRRMSKSGMLFDIADAALRFAGTPIRPGMSFASTAAESLAASKLLPRISQRADAVTNFEQKQLSDKRQMNLAALTQAETSLAAKKVAAARKEEANIGAANRLAIAELNIASDKEIAGNAITAKETLEGQKAEIATALANLKNNFSLEAERLKANLKEKTIKLEAGLRAAQSSIDFANDKTLLGIKNKADQDNATYNFSRELVKIGINQSNSKDLLKIQNEDQIQRDKTLNGYDKIAAINTRMYERQNAVLNRIFENEQNQNAIVSRENIATLERELRKEFKDTDVDQKIIDRQVARYKTFFEKRIAEGNLTVAQLKAETDKDYKNRMALVEEGKNNTLSLGSSFDAEAIKLFSNADMIAAYNDGTLGADHTLFLNSAIDRYTLPKKIFDEKSGTYIESKNEIGSELLAAINNRKTFGAAVPTRYSGETVPPSNADKETQKITQQADAWTTGLSDVNFKSATGPWNFLLDTSSNFLGLLTGKTTAKETSKAKIALESVNAQTTLQLMADLEGKDAVDQRKAINDLLPRSGNPFETDEKAISRITGIMRLIDANIVNQQAVLQKGIANFEDRTAAEDAITRLTNLNFTWSKVKESFEQSSGNGLTLDSKGVLRNKKGLSIDDLYIRADEKTGGKTK